ncbi:unnamed protein product [Pleuronectes platessa]|uniref:Uncharacterized protein n=1 Tax=Pleuronectes platessa TaxID=8262 RepID=A0A9N7UXL6_PLEPL|nr:unnamed protein product [Pleuronectes platessa]
MIPGAGRRQSLLSGYLFANGTKLRQQEFKVSIRFLNDPEISDFPLAAQPLTSVLTQTLTLLHQQERSLQQKRPELIHTDKLFHLSKFGSESYRCSRRISVGAQVGRPKTVESVTSGTQKNITRQRRDLSDLQEDIVLAPSTATQPGTHT